MAFYNRAAKLLRSDYVCICLIGICSGMALQNSWGQSSIPTKELVQKSDPFMMDLFAADLEILSQRLGVAFVAEGKVFPVTQEKPKPTLNEKLSPEEAVREVADYFDYSAVRKGDVFLLRKRYTNPEDLPDVSAAECRSGMKAISKILAAFNPRVSKGEAGYEPMADIAGMLSIEQLEQLSKNGLPVSELTAAQRNEVQRLALKFYIQYDADAIEKALGFLDTRNPADPIFHWQTVMDVYAFGYDTRSVNLNKMLFINVSDTDKIAVYPNGGTARRKSVHTRNGVVVPSSDPTDPAGIPESTKFFLDDIHHSAHSASLSQSLSALNKRADNKVVYKVDPACASKRVTLIGTDKLPAEELVNSLAEVYGLRLAHNEDSSVVVKLPMIVEAKSLSDIGRSVRSAIPDPIYRAMRSRTSYSPTSRPLPEPFVSLTDYSLKESDMHHAALRMFLYLAEPQVKSQKAEKLALSRMGTRARNLFEYTSTAVTFAKACWIADRSDPPYITDFDHITLTGGLYRNDDGKKSFSLYFSYRDPKTGEQRQGDGFSTIGIPQ